MQDQAEQSDEKLILVFLDWEKTFVNVDQEKDREAMKRLGLPQKMIDVLSSFYVKPQFRVKEREGKSSYRTQKAGIRQGCPLSPYLFICLMSVMFHDVHEEIDSKIGTMARSSHPLLDHWELVYALIGKRSREFNIILAAIEKTSAKYSLKVQL